MKKQIKKARSAHINALYLRNFKGFKKADSILLRPLTFLVGQNSSGKSSVIDAILFIIQSGFGLSPRSNLTPIWEGPLIDLGSFRDVSHQHNEQLCIWIGLETAGIATAPWGKKGLDLSMMRIDFGVYR